LSDKILELLFGYFLLEILWLWLYFISRLFL